MLAQERARGQDHSRLAKSTLRDVLFDPGALAGMVRIGRKTFDRGEGPTGGVSGGNLAGAQCQAVLKDGAGAADADATAELGAS